MSEESLQIVEERREVKGKEKRERHTQLNVKIQSIARRDKKAFFRDQCKDIEEKNRTGKTRDLFKKIRDTKGAFYAKVGTIKDRNSMDLTEEEDIKKRWQEYTEKLYKKGLNDLDQNPHNYTMEVTKRFKRLDLIDTVPEELWTEVHNIVQEVVTKTIPKKK